MMNRMEDLNPGRPSPSKSSLLGLDGLNFLMADVRDGVGPFLSVYLKGSQHWAAGQIGIAMAASSLAAAIGQIPAGVVAAATPPFSARADEQLVVPGDIRHGPGAGGKRRKLSRAVQDRYTVGLLTLKQGGDLGDVVVAEIVHAADLAVLGGP